MSRWELFKQTWVIRVFCFFRIPLIFFCSPRVLKMDHESCEILVPLNWRTRNHWRSMYFGALAVGADLAPAAYAMWKIKQSDDPAIQLVFKDFKANFLKRPMDDVVFICTESEKIDAQIRAVIQRNTRVTETIRITAFESRDRTTPVAEFELGLSLKRPGTKV